MGADTSIQGMGRAASVPLLDRDVGIASLGKIRVRLVPLGNRSSDAFPYATMLRKVTGVRMARNTVFQFLYESTSEDNGGSESTWSMVSATIEDPNRSGIARSESSVHLAKEFLGVGHTRYQSTH